MTACNANSPHQIENETKRLLAVCAERGVEAIVTEVASCYPLLIALAEACNRGGLISAGQYLDYLATPYQND